MLSLEYYSVNFGALPQLPDRWFVAYHPRLEMYMAHGPNEWESMVTCDRFQARRWCIDAARGED